MKVWIRVAVAAAFTLVSALPAQPAPEVGQKAPAFALRDLYDAARVVDSAQVFAGKTTLISFFATWCKPCLHELPRFKALADRYAARGFQVLVLCLDRLEEGEIRDFLSRAGISGLPILWDEDGDAMAEYGVFNLPTNVVVDATGTVTMAWQGYLPETIDALEARLESLPPTASRQ